jgi:sialate O-acetylesterase
MIKDWRAKWTQGTSGNTDPEFAFGWAQLNSCSNATHWIENATADPTPGLEDPFGMWNRGLQSIRLAQDATLALPSTFQAVILDTPVASGAIHSPYKQPAGARLARGALNLVYGSPQPYPKVCLFVIDTPPCECTVRVCCDLAVDPCQTAVMNLPHCHWTVL